MEMLDPPPQKYYLFTSVALVPKRKKQIFDLFREYMESEANIVDQIAIEDFFNYEKNHDLIPKNRKIFESYPEGYDPNRNKRGVLREEIGIGETPASMAERKKKQMQKDLLFPWFADGAQYYEVFPELFVDPRLKNNKTQETVVVSRIMRKFVCSLCE